MPHHNPAPRRAALALALGIILVGVWAATRDYDEASTRTSQRQRLIARREKLLADLVRLEREQRDGRVSSDRAGHPDPAAGRRYSARREEIIAALEQVYGALDTDGVTPGPGNTAGVAA
jgi:hypothetical protein